MEFHNFIHSIKSRFEFSILHIGKFSKIFLSRSNFQGGDRGAGGETELGDVGADQRGEERVYAPGELVSRRGGRLCPGSAAFALSVACSTPTTPSPRQVSHLQ